MIDPFWYMGCAVMCVWLCWMCSIVVGTERFDLVEQSDQTENPKSKRIRKNEEKNHAALTKKCKEVKLKNDIIFGYIEELEKK